MCTDKRQLAFYFTACNQYRDDFFFGIQRIWSSLFLDTKNMKYAFRFTACNRYRVEFVFSIE